MKERLRKSETILDQVCLERECQVGQDSEMKCDLHGKDGVGSGEEVAVWGRKRGLSLLVGRAKPDQVRS